MGLLIGVGQTRPQNSYDYYYGIEWDVTVSNAHPTRIGKMELHQTLPLQSQMKRCLLADDGNVNVYLHANNSALTDTGATANLTGANGQVMVELPDMYVRFEMDGNKRRHLQSTKALPGFHKWGKDYVSAYEAALQRTGNKLSSVVNTSTDFRGGGNNASWDADPMKTLLGRPATNISLTNFRSYARNRGGIEWNCNDYAIQKKLWWLFAVEYCTFNSQEAFNAELTSEGFHQGGLGEGVTTLDGGKWNTFNGYNPFIPCGTTNSLGNRTGEVNYTLTAGTYETNAKVVKVNSYRGVELPFGHVWKWTDGCKVLVQSEAAGGVSRFLVCTDPTNYSSANSDANYLERGNLPRTNGYVKEIILGEHGEIMPLSIGGGSTTYFCDYFYTSVPSSGTDVRGVLFGGIARNGANAGFVCAYTHDAPSTADANIGSRLCFIPQGAHVNA